MRLTFKGFLRGYVQSLTRMETTSLARLVREVDKSAPHAAEALFAYAAARSETGRLLKLSEGMWMHESYQDAVLGVAEAGGLEEWLTSDSCPERYHKVWLAYEGQLSIPDSDRRIKTLMLKRIREALDESGRTAYGVIHELGLNSGNAYAYLRGDVSKLSRDSARKLLEAARR